MDRLDELAALVAILDAGSLAAAGRRLRRSPPAMTRLLAALETRVGTRLIERTSRRLTPTDAGRRLAGEARALLASYDGAVGEAASESVQGVLRVTAPLVFGRRHVTPVITSFLAAHSAVRVEVVLDDDPLDLVGERIDVAVRIGRLEDSSLVARKVGEVRRLTVASPRYLSSHRAPRTPRDLVTHDLVATSPRTDWRFRRERVRVRPRLVVNEVDAMLIAVRAGHGIGRPLSYQVADDLATHSLVRLLPEHEPAPLPVQLVVASTRHLAPKVRAFLDHAAFALASLPIIRP